VESVLAASFSARMVADVPVGVFLSGGVDSSLVTALLRKHHPEAQLKTFCMSFEEERFSEAKWAAAVAHEIGTDHEEFLVGEAEALELARNWGAIFDEPFADESGIPTALLARHTVERVKVALSADGGDELFGGYRHYRKVASVGTRLAKWPSGVLKVAPIVDQLVNWDVSALNRSAGRVLHRKLGLRVAKLAEFSKGGTADKWFDLSMRNFSERTLQQLLGESGASRMAASEFGAHLVEGMCEWDLAHFLANDLMVKVDRTTMHFSLEGREPFLDQDVVDTARALPPSVRFDASETKPVLRRILRRHISHTLVDRPKQGFSVPLDAWLRGPLRELARDLLQRESLRTVPVLDAAAAARMVDRYYEGDRRIWAKQVWTLLAWALWWRRAHTVKGSAA